MDYFIGIDGGGTKTKFSLVNDTGKILNELQYGSASYKQIGLDGVVDLVRNGIRELIKDVDAKDAAYATCFGVPNMGESRKNDALIAEMLSAKLGHFHIKLVNDAEVGWAGSLLLEPGINIVAGTGTIAYGKDSIGHAGRAGGWSDYYSDEGSGKWLGTKCMELFTKQADGRIEKGPLYQLVREHFGITEDMDIIDLFDADYLPYRDKIASLQLVLLAAAKAGDGSAIAAYEMSAHELALMIQALYKKLEFKEKCNVSYSGGIFKTGDLILEPLKKEMSHYNIDFRKPECEPVIGAVLLAMEAAGHEEARKNFLKNKND